MSFKSLLRGYSPTSFSKPSPALDAPVQSGLAVTPSKMLEMAQHGVPISTSNESSFFDGVKNPSWDIDIALDRRADVNDIWTAERESSAKIKHAHNKDREDYDLVS